MKKFLIAAVLAALPATLAGQSRIAVGVGSGFTQSDELSGGAVHAQASARLLQIVDGLSVRGEALYQQGSVSGSPFECQQARQQYCLGRTDDNRILGGGVYARIDFTPRGPLHAYLTPVGVGVYHRRTHSSEAEGPTGICVENNVITSCPGNPPFTPFSQTTSAVSLGWTTGAGLELEVGRGMVFAEIRAHSLLERSGQAGALPLTVGISF